MDLNEFANMLGMSPQSVKRWAAGRNMPIPSLQPLIIQKIAQRLVEQSGSK